MAATSPAMTGSSATRSGQSRGGAGVSIRAKSLISPGENPDGKYHFNPGNMAGKKPGDATQTDENRGKPHEPEEKPAD